MTMEFNEDQVNENITVLKDRLSFIQKAINKVKEDREPLRRRWESDYKKLWRLEPFVMSNAEEGEFDNYTTTIPRSYAKKFISILGSADVKISIPIKTEDENIRRLIGGAERFIYGERNLANSRMVASSPPGILPKEAFYAIIRGWICRRDYIYPTEDGRIVFDIQVWDPLTTYWETGGDGLLWICHERIISPSAAMYEYGIELKKKTPIFDFWDGEYNAIFLKDSWIKPPTRHELDHVPAIVVPSPMSPYIQSENDFETIADYGESFYDTYRHISDNHNKIMTFYTTTVGLGVNPPMIVESLDGKKTLGESPYGREVEVDLSKQNQENVRPMFTPTMPADSAALVALIQREVDMNIPTIAFGIGKSSSGYETALLIKQAEDSLLPFKKMIETAEEWGAREGLTQYAQGNFPGVRIHGRTGTNEYFDMVLSSEDIQGDWFPEARLVPDLPRDEVTAATIAQIYKQNEILSTPEIMSRYAHVDDPDMEMDKIDEERANKMPNIMLRRLAASLIRRRRFDLAQIVLDELQFMEEQIKAQRTPKSPFRQDVRTQVRPKEGGGYTPEMEAVENEAWPEP